MLVNAERTKNVRDAKADVQACRWLAQLLYHPLVRGSFIPAQTIRKLRDLNAGGGAS